ncbi:MAG: hypothetical protein KBC39_02870 [Thermotogae bacterium]|jgi:hypothetical protein|nr:hypothetical protein [Thermotogota bacterium]HPX97441.1 hypothetical protein [Thermotogota bacterium]
MDEGFLKEFILTQRAQGLSRDDLYRLALLSFGSEWEPLILMVLAQVFRTEVEGQREPAV